MNARAGTAPCGHRGVYVVGQYVACTEGCDSSDAVPAPIEEDERTRPLCKGCGSDDLERYLPHAFLDVYQCRGCGTLTY